MMLHYFSTKHKKNEDLENKLYFNVLNGYIPPYQFGRICDFMFDDKNKKYYIGVNVDIETGKDVNIRRYSIGLNSIEHQQRNYFKYNKNIRDKKANAIILLE